MQLGSPASQRPRRRCYNRNSRVQQCRSASQRHPRRFAGSTRSAVMRSACNGSTATTVSHPLENLRRFCPCNVCGGRIDGEIPAASQRLAQLSRMGDSAMYPEWHDGHEKCCTRWTSYATSADAPTASKSQNARLQEAERPLNRVLSLRSCAGCADLRDSPT